MKNKTETHIRIQGNNIKVGPWIYRCSVRNFSFKEKDGVRFALTKKSFYLDTVKDKVRYRHMSCKGASYAALYDVYMEVRPGVFIYCQMSTDENVDAVVNRYLFVYKEYDYANLPEVDSFISSLTEKS